MYHYYYHIIMLIGNMVYKWRYRRCLIRYYYYHYLKCKLKLNGRTGLITGIEYKNVIEINLKCKSDIANPF